MSHEQFYDSQSPQLTAQSSQLIAQTKKENRQTAIPLIKARPYKRYARKELIQIELIVFRIPDRIFYFEVQTLSCFELFFPFEASAYRIVVCSLQVECLNFYVRIVGYRNLVFQIQVGVFHAVVLDLDFYFDDCFQFFADYGCL